MKKVEKVSIANISFSLDSDAFLSLKQYLDSLHDYYRKDPDGREIIADIEARIAELILEEQIYTKVVSRQLIDTIIAQLGTPQEINNEPDAESAEEQSGEGSGEPRWAGWGLGGESESGIPRRLHRSNESKIFGGVCSGFAKFLDIPVVWVRVVFLAPFILFFLSVPVSFGHPIREFATGWGWVFFVIYVVLWIALPMARTPRQKLEARGERITPESIRQNLQSSVNTPAGKKAASVAAELVTVMGRVVLFFVKFVAAVIGFTLLFAAVAVFMCMMGVLFNPAGISLVPEQTILSMLSGMSIVNPLVFVELALLSALLPLVVIGMALLSFTFGWRLRGVFYGVTLGGWALSVVFLGIVAAGNVRFFNHELPRRIDNWEQYWHGRHSREYQNGKWKIETKERYRFETSGDSLLKIEMKNGAPHDTVEVWRRYSESHESLPSGETHEPQPSDETPDTP